MKQFFNFDLYTGCGLCAVLAILIAPAIALAQPYNYRGNTLDLVDITLTNIVQTVGEGSPNEKEVEFGDWDNDGDLDVVIAVAYSDFGQPRNKIYRNDNGVFQEVSGTSIMPEFSNISVTRNAFLRDYDNDGWLDIILVNDSNVGTGSQTAPGTTKYYRNVHPGGVFSHFVNETNLRLDNMNGAARGAVSFDFDQNGLHDLFMANYPFTTQDRLALNGYDGLDPGFFDQVTGTHLRTDSDYAVDVNSADMNGDGKLDLLIASIGDPNWIVYNDNQGDGDNGVGDFNYPGSRLRTQFAQTPWEGAMDPADLDGDGLVDFLFVNKGGFSSTGADVIMRNLGNDSNFKATFSQHNLSPSVDGETKKATFADLDDDGKLDIILMADDRRPYIYRNASQPGSMKFIEWTPNSAFPYASGGGPHIGWHANAFDTDGDARLDVFVGAFSDDHLFKNQPSTVYEEDNLTGGVIPVVFHNGAPVTIIGTGAMNERDKFTATGIPAGATVSAFLRSYGDVRLRVDDNNGLIAVINDGLAHVAEAYEFTAPGGDLIFDVKHHQVSGDGNLDGLVNIRDARMIRSCFNSKDPACLIFDLDGSGNVTLQDAKLFRGHFQTGQAKTGYVLEINSRTN